MSLNPVDSELIDRLQAKLPKAAFREVTAPYLQEPRGRWAGQAGVVVAPDHVDQVALVIQAAAAARVPVVPYGGGTGLVGGQVCPDGPAPIVSEPRADARDTRCLPRRKYHGGRGRCDPV